MCAPESAARFCDVRPLAAKAATRAARPEQETVAGQTASTCVLMASMRLGWVRRGSGGRRAEREGAAADGRKERVRVEGERHHY